MIENCAIFPGQGAIKVDAFNNISDLEYDCIKPLLTSIGISSISELNEKSDDWLTANFNSSALTIAASIMAIHRHGHKNKYQAAMGHSIGQWTAMYFAEILDLQMLLEVVKERASLMDMAVHKRKSRMFAVIGLPLKKLENELEKIRESGAEVYVSNINSFGNYSIAVNADDEGTVISHLNNADASKIIPIPTSGGWHSPFLNDAVESFKDYLHTVQFLKPIYPVVNNIDGQFLPEGKDELCETLAMHLIKPVRWEESVVQLVENGAKNFHELGYGNLLTRFGFFISRDASFNAYYEL